MHGRAQARQVRLAARHGTAHTSATSGISRTQLAPAAARELALPLLYVTRVPSPRTATFINRIAYVRKHHVCVSWLDFARYNPIKFTQRKVVWSPPVSDPSLLAVSSVYTISTCRSIYDCPRLMC